MTASSSNLMKLKFKLKMSAIKLIFLLQLEVEGQIFKLYSWPIKFSYSDPLDWDERLEKTRRTDPP